MCRVLLTALFRQKRNAGERRECAYSSQCPFLSALASILSRQRRPGTYVISQTQSYVLLPCPKNSTTVDYRSNPKMLSFLFPLFLGSSLFQPMSWVSRLDPQLPRLKHVFENASASLATPYSISDSGKKKGNKTKDKEKYRYLRNHKATNRRVRLGEHVLDLGKSCYLARQ